MNVFSKCLFLLKIKPDEVDPLELAIPTKASSSCRINGPPEQK